MELACVAIAGVSALIRRGTEYLESNFGLRQKT
jgi:hypothetical protein